MTEEWDDFNGKNSEERLGWQRRTFRQHPEELSRIILVYVYSCVCHSYLLVSIKNDLEKLFLTRDALYNHPVCFSKYTCLSSTPRMSDSAW